MYNLAFLDAVLCHWFDTITIKVYVQHVYVLANVR